MDFASELSFASEQLFARTAHWVPVLKYKYVYTNEINMRIEKMTPIAGIRQWTETLCNSESISYYKRPLHNAQ